MRRNLLFLQRNLNICRVKSARPADLRLRFIPSVTMLVIFHAYLN